METWLARNGIRLLHVDPADITPSPHKLTPSNANGPLEQQVVGRQTESTLPRRKDQAIGLTEVLDPDRCVCRLTEAEIRRREIARFYDE
jgi:hypothetical protein